MIESAFWSQRRVLVTGHTGFKGAWLSFWLQKMGTQVSGLALEPPTTPSLFEELQLSGGMNHVIGDIRDLDQVRDAFSSADPEILIHMAAQPLVRESYTDPVGTIATNVLGTAHVLDAARGCTNLKAIVVVTSDKCYEDQNWVWGYRENDPMGGSDPYSSSKGATELIAASYRHSFFHPGQHDKHGVALASVRAGNVIGGGDWAADRLLPDFFRAMNREAPIHLRYPGAIRPWQHVLEPLSGYLTLAQRLYEQGSPYAEGWNFGPETQDCRDVQWITAELCRLWGDNARWEVDPQQDHPHESNTLKLDCSKAKTRLDWTPHWSLSEALSAVVDWQRAYSDGQDMRRVTEQQIQDFLKQS